MEYQDLGKVDTVNSAVNTDSILIEVGGSIRRISIENLKKMLASTTGDIKTTVDFVTSISKKDDMTYGIKNGKAEPIAPAGYDVLVQDSSASAMDAATLELEPGEGGLLVPIPDGMLPDGAVEADVIQDEVEPM